MDGVRLEIPIAFGKISLNKDFGAGYKYEVILEEAKLKKIKFRTVVATQF